MDNQIKSLRTRIGWLVAFGLVVLTGVEYWIAVSLSGSTFPYLVVIALIKAWLILRYFMHIRQLWRGEGDH